MNRSDPSFFHARAKKMKNPFGITTVLILFGFAARLKAADRFASNKFPGEIAIMLRLVTRDHETNVYTVYQKSGGDSGSVLVVRCPSQKREDVFTLDPGLSCISVCPLGDSRSDILAVWSGGASYYVWILSAHKGKVETLLDASSKLFPEVVLSKRSSKPLLLLSDTCGAIEDEKKWKTILYEIRGVHYEKTREVPYRARFRDVQ
jgi:hypothetical protein